MGIASSATTPCLHFDRCPSSTSARRRRTYVGGTCEPRRVDEVRLWGLGDFDREPHANAQDSDIAAKIRLELAQVSESSSLLDLGH